MSANRVSGMSPYLEQRIKEFDIPPFPCGEAMFARILVYRIPSEEETKETFGVTRIIKADMRKSMDEHRTPRGVVVSAGLEALDCLVGHGAMVGDIVWLAPHVFTRYEVTYGKDAKPVEFAFCNVTDIVTNESLSERLHHHEPGETPMMSIGWNRATRQHFITMNETGLALSRTDPKHATDEI